MEAVARAVLINKARNEL